MKIISTIFYTIFIALIIGIAGLLIGTMLPIPGNIEVKIVKSGSMTPAITTGSIVVVKPSASYNVGDVITFGKDTKTDVPTTHRIIAINSDGTFTVKGDANEEQDPKAVEPSTIIGKVIFHVPFVGYVLDFARQPMGFALLIAVPAGLVILQELLTIFTEINSWWKGGGGTGGRPRADDIAYSRRRKMDEIALPMRIRRIPLARPFNPPGVVCSALFIWVFFALHFSWSGGTVSYFSDSEGSSVNIFQAGEWAPPPSEILGAFSIAAVTDEGSGEAGQLEDVDEGDEASSTPLIVEAESQEEGETSATPPDSGESVSDIPGAPATEPDPVAVEVVEATEDEDTTEGPAPADEAPVETTEPPTVVDTLIEAAPQSDPVAPPGE